MQYRTSSSTTDPTPAQKSLYLVWLAVCWWCGLAQGDGVGLLSCIISRADMQVGSTRLAVPLPNATQVLTISISHCSQEIITSDSLTIMALEVEVHSLAEAITAQDGVEQADDLSTLREGGSGAAEVSIWSAWSSARVLHLEPMMRFCLHSCLSNSTTTRASNSACA